MAEVKTPAQARRRVRQLCRWAVAALGLMLALVLVDLNEFNMPVMVAGMLLLAVANLYEGWARGYEAAQKVQSEEHDER